MPEHKLLFEQISDKDNIFRAVIKTKHSRQLYLEIMITNGLCHITDCFYCDRNTGKPDELRTIAKPLKLKSLHFIFSESNLLQIIATQLDRKFSAIVFQKNPETIYMGREAFLLRAMQPAGAKYHFLIFEGVGSMLPDGLPPLLRTRLKNKTHRTIYLELRNYGDGRGIVSNCHYYDRQYKCKDTIRTPSTLYDCFFNYTRSDIIRLVNHQLCCDFNSVLIVTDNTLQVMNNLTPICGAL